MIDVKCTHLYMHPAQMAYSAPPYSNAPHGYQHPQLGMMGSCNPHWCQCSQIMWMGIYRRMEICLTLKHLRTKTLRMSLILLLSLPHKQIIKTAFCRIICKFHALTYLCKIDLIWKEITGISNNQMNIGN